MSFASDVKVELAHTACESACCAAAELAAALRAGGGISFRGAGRYAISITAPDGSIVRHYFALLKRYWGIFGEISLVSKHTLAGGNLYRMTLPTESGRTLLEAVGLWDEQAMLGVREVPRDEILAESCCRAAFLRGAFLTCGTVDMPDKDYHLEFDAPTDEYADTLVALLAGFGIPARKSCRRSKFVVYLKKAESISDTLTLMGAGSSMLKLESIRVRKDVANGVNRQMNCDSSNIARTTGAAQAQLEDIALIDREMGLDKLSDTLRAVALARQSAPDVSLTELGSMLDPKLGKSGVNARMRRLSALAESIRNGTWRSGTEVPKT